MGDGVEVSRLFLVGASGFNIDFWLRMCYFRVKAKRETLIWFLVSNCVSVNGEILFLDIRKIPRDCLVMCRG